MSQSTIRSNDTTSTPPPCWVTVLFPEGLDSPAKIYAFADSEEKTAKLHELINDLLKQNALGVQA